MSLTTLGYGSCNLITTIGYGGGELVVEILEIRRLNQRFRGRRPPDDRIEEDCYVMRASLVNINGEEIVPPVVGEHLKICFDDNPVHVRVFDVRKESSQIVIEATLKEIKG